MRVDLVGGCGDSQQKVPGIAIVIFDGLWLDSSVSFHDNPVLFFD
ncbi:MAG: hypothetical protein V4732_03170 [Pseudomonadota bacterium]